MSREEATHAGEAEKDISQVQQTQPASLVAQW